MWALELHVIAAAYTNNHKEFIFLCKPTTQQLNTLTNQLINILNNKTESGWHIYNRKQLSHRPNNNWKTNTVYSTVYNAHKGNEKQPKSRFFTQYKPNSDKILRTNKTDNGWLCTAKYGVTLNQGCIAITYHA